MILWWGEGGIAVLVCCCLFAGCYLVVQVGGGGRGWWWRGNNDSQMCGRVEGGLGEGNDLAPHADSCTGVLPLLLSMSLPPTPPPCRENLEGEYSGLEHEVVDGVVESLKVRGGCVDGGAWGGEGAGTMSQRGRGRR